MEITVIGAGIVGLTTAWYLQRDGHQVTVIDRRTAVGQGASMANGGQLSYRYVAPLADPDILAKIPGWMLRRDAPVRFRPRFDPAQWQWIMRFLQACNGNDKIRSVAALLPLSLYSQRLIHDLVNHDGFEFDYRQNGKLILHRDRKSFEAARRLLEARPELSGQQLSIGRDACLALEPSLSGIADSIAGGIHTASEETGDCYKLCQALEARLRTGPMPVCFRLGEEVSGFEVNDGILGAVMTRSGRIRGDACVLAGGAEVARLLVPLGIRVPVYPLKGYSISLSIDNPDNVPEASVTDYQRKIVYARLGNRLRIAGMADIVGFDDGIPADRVAGLLRETSETFGEGVDLSTVEPWAGLRPATPTGRPVVDRSPIPNLWLNVGHGALGFTLAAGCAGLIADKIGGRQCAVPAADFELARSTPSGWGVFRGRRAACPAPGLSTTDSAA